jgi:hypothetical protein
MSKGFLGVAGIACLLSAFACQAPVRNAAANDSSAVTAGIVGSQRLQTLFTGGGKCLDIVNDGVNDQTRMADCGNYSGQAWTFSDAGNGFFRLTTLFTGTEKCLDVVNDGVDDKLHMADCGNYSGQFWSLEASTEPGYVHLRTLWLGDSKCLDIVNDGSDDKLQMADCGNYSGQFWATSLF